MTHLCRWMRWKGFHGVERWTEAELDAVYAENEVQWSCLATARSWGPDDELCAPEACGPGRPCFEASKKLVRGLV